MAVCVNVSHLEQLQSIEAAPKQTEFSSAMIFVHCISYCRFKAEVIVELTFETAPLQSDRADIFFY